MANDAARRWVGDMAEAYERWLVPPVFAPFAADLADRVANVGPSRVLEVAAGTGAVTRELVARLGPGAVVATDLNEAMVATGSGAVPGAEWRVADATSLAFEDASFDAVACQFGAMFFPDKPAAFAELRRVLAPGGTLFLSVWGTLADHGFGAPVLAIVRDLLPEAPPDFLDRIPHGYADPDRVRADLAAGGFPAGGIHVEAVDLAGTAPSTADLARGFCRGTPMRPEIEAQADLDEVAEATAARLVASHGPGPLVAEMRALVATAHVPPIAPTGD